MRRILLYIIVIVLLFSGFNQVKSIWEENQKDLDETYADVKTGIFGWFQTAKETSIELKEKLNVELGEASKKYEDIKIEIDATTKMINEKRAQLELTLKEIEDAKKALDELLKKEQEAPAASASAEASAEASVQ